MVAHQKITTPNCCFGRIMTPLYGKLTVKYSKELNNNYYRKIVYWCPYCDWCKTVITKDDKKRFLEICNEKKSYFVSLFGKPSVLQVKEYHIPHYYLPLAQWNIIDDAVIIDVTLDIRNLFQNKYHKVYKKQLAVHRNKSNKMED